MDRAKIYISCPINTAESLRVKAKEIIDLLSGISDIWKVGHNYTNKALLESEGLLIILPKEAYRNSSATLWGSSYNQITLGTRTEIKLAIERQIPVFLLYESLEGFRVYNTVSDGKGIQGVAGTSSSFKHFIAAINKKKEFNKAKEQADIDFGVVESVIESPIKECITSNGRVYYRGFKDPASACKAKDHIPFLNGQGTLEDPFRPNALVDICGNLIGVSKINTISPNEFITADIAHTNWQQIPRIPTPREIWLAGEYPYLEQKDRIKLLL